MPCPGAGTKRSGSSTAAGLGLAPEPLQPGAREHDRVAGPRPGRRACAGGCRRCRGSPPPRGPRGRRAAAPARRMLLVPTRAPGRSSVEPSGSAEDVLGRRARRGAEQREPVGQLAGNVLGGVHREVDLARGQRRLELCAPSGTCPSRARARGHPIPAGERSGRSRSRRAGRSPIGRRSARPVPARARCAAFRSASAGRAAPGAGRTPHGGRAQPRRRRTVRSRAGSSR